MMKKISKRKILKRFSNFGVRDPVERSINDICKDIHTAVCRALDDRDLTAVVQTIRTELAVIGRMDFSKRYTESCKATEKKCEEEFINECKNYNKLAKLAVTRYNAVITDTGYKYRISDMKFTSQGYYNLNHEFNLPTKYSYEGNFSVDIILDGVDPVSFTGSDIIDNMDKKEW